MAPSNSHESNGDGQRVFRSMREICLTFTPRRHETKECGCYPKREGHIYIIPRPGVNR